MSNLTEKQRKFVEARAQGIAQTQAALLAGYSAASAKVMASQLGARADIKAAIKAAKGKAKRGSAAPVEDDERPLLKDRYDSPLDLMEDVMNNPRVPFGLRVAAAKDALPYRHAKVGEAGKKEKAKDRAAEVAQGRFKSKAPPRGMPLTVVK